MTAGPACGMLTPAEHLHQVGGRLLQILGQ